jgi:hypothetical protein
VKLIMPTIDVAHPHPRLSQQARTHRFKEYGKGFNRQRKITLPLTAWRSVDQLAGQVGVSVPGLLLALSNIDQATIGQLRAWAEDAAHAHGHFLTVENEDGTRTRISAGRYRRGGGQ